MNRSVAMVGLCSLISVPALARQNAETAEVRVYDVRELLPSLAGPAPAPAVVVDLPLSGAESPFSPAAPPPAPLPPGPEDIIMRLAGIMGLAGERLAPGIVAITGAPSEHRALGAAMDSLRELVGPPVEVEIAWFTRDGGPAVSVGSKADVPAGARRAAQSIQRGTMGVVSSIEDVAFPQDWTPIVSEQSVGYEMRTGHAERGLAATVTLAPSKGGPARAHIAGILSDVTFQELSVALTGSGPAKLIVALPSVSRRLIDTTLDLAPGDGRVIAVVPGASEGQSIVMVATVREFPAAR